MPCPGGPRVPDQPHGPVKPTRPLPFSSPTRQSQVALDPHTNVWTIASTFPRRNPTFVHSSGPNFTGTHGTKGSSIRLRCLESLHFPGRSLTLQRLPWGNPIHHHLPNYGRTGFKDSAGTSAPWAPTNLTSSGNGCINSNLT